MVATRKSQQGISLVEILVAVLVLSVGLLGVIELHIVAKRGSVESLYYSQAMAMANDMAERIRLNPLQRDSYVGSDYGTGTIIQPSTQCTGSASQDCTNEELVSWDRFQWANMLAGAQQVMNTSAIGAPPQAVGCVYVMGNDVEIMVTWQGTNETSDSANNKGSMAMGCGKEGAFRRMVAITTTVVDRI